MVRSTLDPTTDQLVASLVASSAATQSAIGNAAPVEGAPVEWAAANVADQPSTPAAETPVAQTPVTQIPAAETAVAQTPAAETPAAGTPAAGTPAAGTPAAASPAAETPAAGTPAAGAVVDANAPHVPPQHQWVHTALEGESDARAILLSFLLRQLVLFTSTGRIPSTHGDAGHHGEEEWYVLGCWTLFNVVVLILASITKERYHWSGGEGDLGDNLHFSQLLLAMWFGWNSLTAGHWYMQGVLRHPAGWNVGTAFLMTPICFLVIIVIDKLADLNLIGPKAEPVFINSAGLVLGFAWEVAFSAAITTFITSLKWQELADASVLLLLVVTVLPAWKFYIVPRASQPVPSRVPGKLK